MASKKETEKPVLVTTEHRGVFFGYETGREQGRDGVSITLAKARNCLYWSADVKGFMGLALTGPTKGCRIGPEVSSIELMKVTSIVEVAAEAVKAWSDAPWSR